MMDVYSRFEQEAVMEDEHPETEIKLIEQYWIRWAGPPMSIKTDASGSHMSEKFVQWMDSLGIKLIVIPKEAHYRLGVMERAHAVRRAQLMKMHDEYPDLELEEAARYTAEQRNRLRTVHGSCPSAIVFGAVPAQHGLADEPFNMAAADAPCQERVRQLRASAATAFHQVNTDRALVLRS